MGEFLNLLGQILYWHWKYIPFIPVVDSNGNNTVNPLGFNLVDLFFIYLIILFLLENLAQMIVRPEFYKDSFWSILGCEVLTLFITALLILLLAPIISIAEICFFVGIPIFIMKYLSNLNIITIKRKDESENILVNRIMCKKLGKDKYGELFTGNIINSRDERGITFVKVKNSTKKYGIKENYYIVVPNSFSNGNHTPKEAVAWTFNLSESEYNPELES